MCGRIEDGIIFYTPFPYLKLYVRKEIEVNENRDGVDNV